ncbi:MAG TPA: P-loop NTPase, partial [Solirubrobacteraceae bacterium]|nr:P-loop NTPase [Solirubrobacteraceae bacterium]
MDEPLYALCLSTDPAVSSTVVALLARIPGFAVTARELDYQIGNVDLQDMREPHLAIVILGKDATAGLAVIEEVHKSAPATQVLAVAADERPETIVKAMRAGADEFLPLPLDATALLKVCIKVSALRKAAKPGNAAQRADFWVAYGAKGGVGTTTLVANLGIALQAAGRRTALLDLDLVGGDLALFLNVTPSYTLRDVATNTKRLDDVYLQGTMLRHRSGLDLIAAPVPLPGEAPLALTSEQTLGVFKLLDTSHDVVLVDTTSIPLDATRTALTNADRIFLVTELALPALRASLRAIEWMREEGIELESTVEVVVN